MWSVRKQSAEHVVSQVNISFRCTIIPKQKQELRDLEEKKLNLLQAELCCPVASFSGLPEIECRGRSSFSLCRLEKDEKAKSPG